ncbi:glycosyltransferase family 2 protein [Micromonospora sp. NPDC050417]|uniref:glycosyltransferase family 2 protein n=1 Tax=Micromonospora sp. NPDC050417 TaxID=3364280 RepID=UPI00379CB950
MTTPEVSILLVSWNTKGETRDCLDSLPVGIDDGLRYEVVAVDNGSRDGSAEMLETYPQVRLSRNDRNIGFAAAVNQAYRQARGDLILLLNSDVRFHPGALSTMVEFIRLRPDAAGVSPLYLNPDGTFQQHYVQLPSFAATIALVTAVRRLPGFRQALHRFQMRGEDFSRPRPLASGSCMLLRRSVLPPERIFDERFPIYWNDAVLARTLQDAGHQLWMIPHAAVTHSRGASCRRLGPAIRFRHLLGSLVGYLGLTEPQYRLNLFRLVVLADHALKRLCGRPVQLGLPDLRAALRGDVGPLPDGDIRDWLVILGDAVPGDADLADTEEGRRILVARPPAGRSGWRLRVLPVGDSVWHGTLPAPLPFGRYLPWVNRWNLRIAAGQLRQWLDKHAGARVLCLDERYRPVLGRLGEDEVLDHPPALLALDPVHV